MSPLKSCLPPVWNADAKVLILGSLPGEVSLARQRYYGHPRNQFWTLLDSLLQLDPSSSLTIQPYDQRLESLRQSGIALWDVVAHAERKGSLDSNLRGLVGNDLPAFVSDLPALRAIAFNGQTAGRIGQQLLRHHKGIAQIILPSSSPAYTLSLAEKQARWQALAHWLNPAQATRELTEQSMA
jgi:double-stranded uracil-DNA glycosylase